MNRYGSSLMPQMPGMWGANGYSGGGNVEGLVNSLQGRLAVVCGSAEGVFEQFEAVMALDLDPDPVVFAANDVGMFLRRVDHWVSLHSEQFAQWKPVRWLHHRGYEDTQYHGVNIGHPVQWAWEELNPTFALSGYFAMQIAWIMGAKQIILCGCPGDRTRRFFDPTPRSDFGYGGWNSGSDKGIKVQLISEMNRLPDFKSSVRSMGGWTKEFFGGL